MATIGTTNVTLMDIARRLDPQGKIDKIVEIHIGGYPVETY